MRLLAHGQQHFAGVGALVCFGIPHVRRRVPPALVIKEANMESDLRTYTAAVCLGSVSLSGLVFVAPVVLSLVHTRMLLVSMLRWPPPHRCQTSGCSD